MSPNPGANDNYHPDPRNADDDLDADEVLTDIEDVLDAEDRLRDHPLVRAVGRGDEGIDLLRVIQHEIARACAQLGWLDENRDEFEDEELLERGRAITRQVRAMKRLAELELLRIRRFGTQPTQLEGNPQVHQVLGLLLDRICEVAHEVLPATTARGLDAKFRVALEADTRIPWP